MPIEVKNLSFSYGDRPVLHDISFSVDKGEFLSILGPNGVGKSTLFSLPPEAHDQCVTPNMIST